MKKNEISFCGCVTGNLLSVRVRMVFFAILMMSHFVSGQAGLNARCGAQHLGNKGHSSFLSKFSAGLENRSVVEIPVVVHVVWNSFEEDISDEQIFSQIEVLNQDFNVGNIELADIPAVFQPLIADIEMEFCLAKVDPEGNATTGITRTFTQNSVGIGGSTNLHYTAQGGHDAWDTEHYLNIWVAKFAGGVGGVASFPGEGPAAEQGVEIDYRQFGTVDVEPPYHLGRTCTHEIGHFFNLEHPWGPNFDDCCADDFVADTPEACDTYLGDCPNFPISSCSGPDMFMNYMFYTNDACMGMFTLGQKQRMLATLTTDRAGLMAGIGCVSVSVEEEIQDFELKILGNPIQDELSFEILSRDNRACEIELIDRYGRLRYTRHVDSNVLYSIDCEGFTPGLYFVRASSQEKEKISSVVIFRQ